MSYRNEAEAEEAYEGRLAYVERLSADIHPDELIELEVEELSHPDYEFFQDDEFYNKDSELYPFD